MTVKEVLAKLESLGDEGRRDWNVKSGADKTKTFGVQTGDIRALAKKIKANHELALELWKTGNIDAQLLAILLMKPKELSSKELDKMVRAATFVWVADWLNAYIVREQPADEKESLRARWMNDKDGWAARAGWNLMASKINKGDPGADLDDLLDRIEKEMPRAPAETQWTMNNALIAIGLHHAKLRKRAIAIGEKLGIYRDYPCSKGCVSPFAPIAITEMVKRQG